MDSWDEDSDNDHLHHGIRIKSDKQNSAQGSVFYCNRKNSSQELILKVYKI